jgi:hypothetical protein
MVEPYYKVECKMVTVLSSGMGSTIERFNAMLTQGPNNANVPCYFITPYCGMPFNPEYTKVLLILKARIQFVDNMQIDFEALVPSIFIRIVSFNDGSTAGYRDITPDESKGILFQ